MIDKLIPKKYLKFHLEIRDFNFAENADEINPYATFDMCDGGGAPFQNARHHELYYGHGNSLVNF